MPAAGRFIGFFGSGGGFTTIAVNDPVFSQANALFHQMLRAPKLEPPVVTVFLIHLAHGTPEIQRFHDAFFHQRSAAWGFHHGGGDVAAGNDAVLRAGAGVHQISLIKEVGVEFGVL